MTGRVIQPYHRRGTAGGHTYTTVVGPWPGGGWGWGGHRYSTDTKVEGFGEQIAGHGPFKYDYDATRAADQWFDSISDIVETTGQP